MGIDLKAGGHIRLHKRYKLHSPYIYYHLLVKLYKFLSRRTKSKFNKSVLNKNNIKFKNKLFTNFLIKTNKIFSKKTNSQLRKNEQEIILAK